MLQLPACDKAQPEGNGTLVVIAHAVVGSDRVASFGSVLTVGGWRAVDETNVWGS